MCPRRRRTAFEDLFMMMSPEVIVVPAEPSQNFPGCSIIVDPEWDAFMDRDDDLPPEKPTDKTESDE